MKSNWQLLAKQLENGTDFEQEMVTEIGDLMYRRIVLFEQSIATYTSARFDDISQDAITVKSGIIGKILLSRAHGRPLKFFKVFLYIFNYYFKKLSGTGKNYAYCKCE